MQENLCNATAIFCNVLSLAMIDFTFQVCKVNGAAVHGNVKKRKMGQYVCSKVVKQNLLSMMHLNFKVTEKRCLKELIHWCGRDNGIIPVL